MNGGTVSPRPAERAGAPRLAGPGLGPDSSPGWDLATFAGRLTELSGSPAAPVLTLAFRLVLEAQRRHEPVAWIGRRDSIFFPPDVAEAGVDLAALPVIFTGSPMEAARAADLLVRSGGFGMVILDLGEPAHLPLHAQTRLAGLAKRHQASIVFLTEKEGDRPSVGALVSLRAQAVRTVRDDDRFRCEIRILKDKRRGPGWSHSEWYRGPDGLV